MPRTTTDSKSRLLIRVATQKDWPSFIAAVRASRPLHAGWVSPPKTRKQFNGYLKRISSGDHYGFLLIDKATNGLIGVINLNNIIRASFRNSFLGYYCFSPFAGKGLMREGLLLVLRFAFRELRLHRLEANIQPDNHPSIALVRGCGFVREGYSRRYLKVCGRWCDHERWALLAEDWLQP